MIDSLWSITDCRVFLQLMTISSGQIRYEKKERTNWMDFVLLKEFLFKNIRNECASTIWLLVLINQSIYTFLTPSVILLFSSLRSFLLRGISFYGNQEKSIGLYSGQHVVGFSSWNPSIQWQLVPYVFSVFLTFSGYRKTRRRKADKNSITLSTRLTKCSLR